MQRTAKVRKMVDGFPEFVHAHLNVKIDDENLDYDPQNVYSILQMKE